MSEWLGHRDLCSLQWSTVCDCDVDAPTDFSQPEDLCRHCAAGLPDHCPQCGGCETSLSPKFCTCWDAEQQHPITP